MDTGLKEFIGKHIGEDAAVLALRYHDAPLPFSLDEAITQISARQKTSAKLPWFNSHDSFIYPSVAAAEQATNQYVARFHARIVADFPEIADLTAGLGIDSIVMAANGHQVMAFELDTHRADCLRHNCAALDIRNIDVVNADSIEWLKACDRHFDAIFIDPARRDSLNNRVFRLQDSLPDVPANLPLLLHKCRNLFVKGSPLLDISQTMRDLQSIEQINIVSFKGECKEVLVHMKPDASLPDNPAISVIDIGNNDAGSISSGNILCNYEFECRFHDLDMTEIIFADKNDLKRAAYVYELGAGMRKLHADALLCGRYPGLKCLKKNTGIFISDTPVAGFPGHAYRLIRQVSGGELEKMKKEPLHVVSHGHPLNAAKIRSKYRLMEGDGTTLLAGSLNNGSPIFILAEKVDVGAPSVTVTSRKADFSDIPLLRKHFERYRSFSCDYSLGGVLLWKDYFDYRIVSYGEDIMIVGKDPASGVTLYYPPVNGASGCETKNSILDILPEANGCVVKMIDVPVDGADDAPEVADEAVHKPEWDDYVYNIEQFIGFEGKKMAKKRNHLNYFHHHYPDAEISEITAADIDDIVAFTRTLDALHATSPLFLFENRHCTDLLPYLGEHGMAGIVIRHHGKVIGFTYGEAVGEMFFAHVEKGDMEYPGVYQALASGLVNLAISRFEGLRYVNREDDAGNEALRKSKLSYHPAMMVRKYLTATSTTPDDA